ncbi:hypothetical protein ETAA8_40720 [Anatilimnocola aggregata]|uniref:DUF1579 domain-containing protein n=1 Tax=Anatilimnocola aggregata TaxID=2528021 RepID=A0A517YFG0_9BACT|nr:hypothetical protein [Anatilimnocola aggregata]QDU28966.1 hypothetical protein ETAA8_40720 [Anatilimnocola aggregata]
MRRSWFAAFGLLAVLITAGWVVALSFAGQDVPKASSESPPAETQAAVATDRQSPLDTLDWLVGDWVNEDENRPIEFNCHFTKNGSFLVRSFRIITEKDVRMSGMQVIAWDPAQQSIRSWTFDSDGGFGEDTWTQSGNRYTIRAHYTLPDGGIASAINVFTFVDDNKCTWKSVSREIDGELQPDTDEVVLVRKTSELKPAGGK